jgi:arginine metabolism regulation protein II
MSKALRSNLAAKPIDESLLELEAKCRDGPPHSTDGLVVGPFGVFTLETPTRGTPAAIDSPQPLIEPQVTDGTQDEIALPSVDSVGTLADMNDFLDWPDLFDLDLTGVEYLPQSFDSNLREAQPETFPVQTYGVPQTSHETINAAYTGDIHAGLAPLHLARIDDSTRGNALEGMSPAEGQLLLNHFKNHVIAQMQIMPIEKKSPWEINNLNAAIMTLARLTYMTSQPVSHAALANFHALLALSANCLVAESAPDGQGSTDYWRRLAAMAAEKAKENLQCSLRSETKGANTAKYKDQLMAILAMLVFAVGDHTMPLYLLLTLR